MGMKLSSYRHYEDRFKGNSFPAEIVDKLLVAFEDHPEVESDIRGLISLASPPRTGMTGLGDRLSSTLPPTLTHTLDDSPTEITIRANGRHIQVMANVDRQGIDKLIEKLTIARGLLD